MIALTLECGDAVAVLDDRIARQTALSLGLRPTGTLELFPDAKHAGLIPAVAPVLDELQARRFRLAPQTRTAVLDPIMPGGRSGGKPGSTARTGSGPRA